MSTEAYRPFDPRLTYWDAGLSDWYGEATPPADVTPTDQPAALRNPLTGEVLVSPRIQEQIRQDFDSAREAAAREMVALFQALEPDHRPDILCAAMMETAIGQALDTLEETVFTAKLTNLLKDGQDLLDAILNTPAFITVQRIADEQLNGPGRSPPG